MSETSRFKMSETSSTKETSRFNVPELRRSERLKRPPPVRIGTKKKRPPPVRIGTRKINDSFVSRSQSLNAVSAPKPYRGTSLNNISSRTPAQEIAARVALRRQDKDIAARVAERELKDDSHQAFIQLTKMVPKNLTFKQRMAKRHAKEKAEKNAENKKDAERKQKNQYEPPLNFRKHFLYSKKKNYDLIKNMQVHLPRETKEKNNFENTYKQFVGRYDK